MPVAASWPLVGSIFHVNKNRSDLSLLKFARQLGPVYAIKTPCQTLVVVSGFNELIEMLSNKDTMFGGRAYGFSINKLTYGFKGLTTNSNIYTPAWRCIKIATSRCLRHFNDGLVPYTKNTKVFVNNLNAYNGKQVDLQQDIAIFFLKVLVTTMTGRTQIEDTDNTYLALLQLGITTGRLCKHDANISGFLSMWPRFFGRHISTEIQELIYMRDHLWDLMWSESQQSYSSKENATCFLNSLGQLLDKNSPHYCPSMDWEHARATFIDLIIFLVINMIGYAYILLNILAQNPQILTRLQTEVDKVLGADRQPCLVDCDLMPYTMATLYELLRFGGMVPCYIHRTLEDTSVGGFIVSKNTDVIAFFTAMLSEPEFWGDPEVFRPERFLDKRGFLVPIDHSRRKRTLLQFGAGLRGCIADNFVIMRWFIFITAMVQKFYILPGSGSLVSYDPTTFSDGFALIPQPFKIRLTPRN